MANTENANVNWKICATIEHKEQQAAGREGATVDQGSCIHTCKHVCVCVCLCALRIETFRFMRQKLCFDSHMNELQDDG